VPIYKLFSHRNRERPEQLVYDRLPESLRAACHRIIREALGGPGVDAFADAVLGREHPTPSFQRSEYGDYLWEDCIFRGDFLEAMDAIELGSQLVNVNMREMDQDDARRIYGLVAPDEAIEELNGRFTQHSVGYQFSKELGRIVKVDSTFMHAEVVNPAIVLLAEKQFEGAAQEFGRALAAFREGRGKDAVTEAVRAVESTAKAILDARSWKYEKGDAIVKLLNALFANGLVPPQLQSHFDGLRSALTSGLPTIGNNFARHGQGATVKPIEEHMVSLGLHLAAATIVFLVEAHKSKP
jgi:hypothetical protein